MAGKVVRQLAGSGTGQSLSDLMTAMKYTLSGSVIVKIICKATTEEMCAPKRKHLSYLVQCTFEPRLSVPDFANQLVIRTQHSNLVVVFKALLTIHHLMQFGNERFSQYIASNNCHFYVPSLHDRNSVQAHGISLFLRPYAKYLDEKAASYREVAFDFCRLKRGKEDGDMRTMPQDKLMKTLPVIEKQLDALLMFDATLNELSNSLLRVAHLSLYRDLIRLYAVYNEGMINLIGRYFTMSKRDCRVSLEIYKNFLKRMESMNTFVRVAECIIEEERTRLESFVSTARQHKFSDHHHDQNNINMNDINQQNYYSMKSDNDNFLDLLSFDELSQTNAKQQFNNFLVSNFKLEEDQRRSHQAYVQEELSSTFPHVLKDTNSCNFNDVPTNSLPFGSNKSPPLLLSAQSTSTLVPVAISPGQLHSTNPFLFNTHPQLSITSKDFMSNQRVSANSTSTSPQMQSNSNTIPSKSLISLDDKIAQIAGNLSICDSYSSTQAGRIYRAPDGSLSTINWSGTMPCVQVSTVSNQQMSQVSTIHQSPSLNQIIGPVNTNHQPTASIPLNPTNPWAASAQSNISYQTQSFMNNPILLNNNNGIVHRSMNNPFL
uniref:Phosphatidylinositol-binding clathrin assembly protein LAP n=1 Tax=Schistosoma haematobium TaxID=6185 RepID=A0A095A411_SCHHA